MTRRVLLHIGLHKTGTTAIQMFMSANSRRFPGVLYPAHGRPEEHPYGHHLLPWSLQRRHKIRPEPVWKELRSEIEGAAEGDAVLSAEAFGMLDAKAVARVRELLPAVPARVIVYLRRQDEFVQAMYATMIASGSTVPPFEDYLKQVTSRGRLDYYALLGRWAAAFGKENLCVRVYGKNSLIDGDVVRDFCAQAGLASSPGLEYPAQNVNRGVPLNVLEILRLMKSMQLPESWIADARRIAEHVYPSHRFYDIMSPRAAKSLLDRCRAGNDRVAREFLNGASALFEETFDYMSDEQWSELYGQPYGFLKKTIDDLRSRVASGNGAPGEGRR
jgi:hypothetical protein